MPWPFRGQKNPQPWDQELKAYIDDADSAASSRLDSTESRLGSVETEQAIRKGTLFYAENTCSHNSMITTILTSAVVIPGIIGVVEPTDKDVWLKFSASLGLSVAGAGFVTMRLYEVLDNGSVLVKRGPVVRTEGLPVTAFGPTIPESSWRLGPTATSRQFYCDTILVREAGSSMAAYLLNSYNNGAGADLAKTWLCAEALG